MLTDQDRAWMARRDELTPAEAEVVESAWKQIRDDMKFEGLTPALNDTAASLEAAMVRYLIESRKP